MPYLVTKHFTSGPLKGLTITETTSVAFEVGRTYTPCAGASAYRVEECRSIAAWPFPLSAADLAARAVEHRRQQRAAIIGGPRALL
jgi:hypothetical protein